ncbi:MAG: hypothetical protein PWR20_424 [Bacteroidales bacterium]|jgi:hypothetical protein|nr:hypothetical protein [Bacteroidales bacterium]MDN5330109.1 hypothetical protein [Bacteroidales bacterium]
MQTFVINFNKQKTNPGFRPGSGLKSIQNVLIHFYDLMNVATRTTRKANQVNP